MLCHNYSSFLVLKLMFLMYKIAGNSFYSHKYDFQFVRSTWEEWITRLLFKFGAKFKKIFHKLNKIVYKLKCVLLLIRGNVLHANNYFINPKCVHNFCEMSFDSTIEIFEDMIFKFQTRT